MRYPFLILLSFTITRADEPFFASKVSPNDNLISKIRFNEYQGPGNDVHPEIDANQILGSFMNPFMEMYDSMQENYKARMYAEKVQRERDENPLSNSKSIFEIFEKLQRPTTTTTPQPPLIERLLKPYIEPWQKQMDYLSQDMIGLLRPTTTTTTTTTQAPITEKKITSLTNDLPKLTPFEVGNPFTPNPLMAAFTMKPLPELKFNSIDAKPIHDPSSLPLIQPTFKIQDPFYNPLFPNRKSKLFDLLAGGEATRILG